MKIAMLAAMAMAASVMVGCTSTPPAAPAAPAVVAPPPPVPGTAGSEKVGPGSKAGFCTFKDAGGKLYEAKC